MPKAKLVAKGRTERRAAKASLIKRIVEKLSQHEQILVAAISNVSSNQINRLRRKLLTIDSDIMVTKNTVFKAAIKMKIHGIEENSEFYEDLRRFATPNPELKELSNIIEKKIALIFSDRPAFELIPLIEAEKIQKPAKLGILAPNDIILKEGPTGIDPGQISAFHGLNVNVKTVKGQIEIVKESCILKEGQVVNAGVAQMLAKLKIQPFFYGLKVICAYSKGAILDQQVLSLSPNDIISMFTQGVTNLTALSLQTGIPIECSIPHMIVNGFKNLIGISMETEYKIKELDTLKSSAPTTQQAETKQDDKKVEKVEEKEEEMDIGAGGLFGNDDEY